MNTDLIMKKLVALTIVSLFGITLTFAQQQKWTLEEAVQHALENNISVKQSELDLKATELDKSDAIGNLLPSLNGSVNSTTSIGTNLIQGSTITESFSFTSVNFGLQSNLTLFDGLRNIRQLQRAKMSRIAAEYNLGKMKDDIALFVANAYLDVLFAKENLKIQKAQNQITEEQLERTNELVDAGVVARGELLDIKSTNATEKQQIIVAENNIRIALISLAQTLLIKDYESFDIADAEFELPMSELLNEPVSSIIAKAKEERFELKIAEQNLGIAQKDLQISRGAYYPSLSASVGYSSSWFDNDALDRSFSQQLSDNAGTRISFQLNVPIFNGLAARNNVKRSKINIERAQLQKEQADLDLESNVYQAYTDVQGALAAYDAAVVAEEAQQQAFDFAQERFDVGFLNSFDFNQVKIRLENTQSEKLRAKYDYIFKLKVLELYFGISLYD